jgi:predicted enzyme related to lactoylglutathione lyase
MGYVGVDNVDATATAVSANGGTVQVLPTDIPNVGRFAVVADPAGAVFALLQPSNPDQQPVPDQEAPGRVGWHELYGADPASGFDFYARLFGWQKTDAMDMGEMGVYQMFGKGDAALGGMMKKPPEMPVACWGYYFNVGNIDQAAARVTAGGGQILQGPMEVPGGQFILQGMDPQGAAFALAGTR